MSKKMENNDSKLEMRTKFLSIDLVGEYCKAASKYLNKNKHRWSDDPHIRVTADIDSAISYLALKMRILASVHDEAEVWEKVTEQLMSEFTDKMLKMIDNMED